MHAWAKSAAARETSNYEWRACARRVREGVRDLLLASGLPLLVEDVHDGRWGLLTAVEVGHDFHGGVDVLEELFVGGAEVVETPFAVGGVSETVLGAFAVAGEADAAVATVLGEAVALGLAKGFCLRAIGEFTEAVVHQVPEFVFGVDVVVAGVKVAIVFHCEGAAAGLGEITKAAGDAEPFAEGDVKELDVGFADVAFDPGVEYFAEEVAVGLGRDGVSGHTGGFAVRGRGFEVGRGGEIESEFGGGGIDFAFDDGDELNVLGADALEEFINFKGVLNRDAVDASKGVELDLVFAKDVESAHDVFVGIASFFVDAVGVVEVFGSVNGEADEEVVFGKEGAPLVVEEGAVGLESVGNGFALSVLFLKGDDLAEVIDA